MASAVQPTSAAQPVGALLTPWRDDDGRDATLVTLDLRGPRGALSGDAARALVARVVSGEDAAPYARLVLSTWAFSEAAAAEVALAVEALRARGCHVRSAVLADLIAGRPEAEGLAVYHTLCGALLAAGAAEHLEELDLSDNAVGTKGVEAWRPLLSRVPRLQRLFFCNCGISAEAARAIADCLLLPQPAAAADSTAAAATTTSLRVLQFDNNMSGGAGAAAVADVVAASPHLRDLRFSSSRGEREGGVALCRALGGATGLVRLDLHDNLFAEPLGVALGAALAPGRLSNLVHLDVGDTLLRDAGVQALASGLVRGCAQSLEHLDVSVNELTAEGGRALGRCVRRLTRLRELFAHENELEDEGALCVARGLLRRADFRRRAASNERRVEGEGEDEDPFEQLDISENMLTDVAAHALAAACAAARLRRLRRLDLARNDELTLGGVRSVRAALAEAALGGVDKAVDLGDLSELEAEGDSEGDEGAGEVAAGDDDADSDLELEGSARVAGAPGALDDLIGQLEVLSTTAAPSV